MNTSTGSMSEKLAESVFGDGEIIAQSTERQVSICDSMSEMDCLEDDGSIATLRNGNKNIKAWDNNSVAGDLDEIIGWGCGEFGQHGHGAGTSGNIGFDQGLLKEFVKTMNRENGVRVIACGASHTVVVTDNDEIYSWGNGNSGQLGCGDKETHVEPQAVKLSCDGPVKIRGVACGSRHTIIWLDNGKCYSFGNNYFGQLGYDFKVKNYKENQVKPQILRPLQHRHVSQVACGERHSIFLFDSGTAAGCGCNANGQIGVGSREEVVTPQTIEGLEDISYISCGPHHSMAVNGKGHVYVWGLAKPCGSKKQDILTPTIKSIPRTRIYRVAGGNYHSLALSVNGAVYSWGKGSDGQLGHGQKIQFLSSPRRIPSNTFNAKISQIVCGEQYTAVLTVDGMLYMWGRNSHTLDPDKPTSHREYQPIKMNTNGCKVRKLACGPWHAVAVTGVPDWKPNDDDTDVEDLNELEENEMSRVKDKESIIDADDERSQVSDLETEAGSDQECPGDLSDDDKDSTNIPPEFLKCRGKTKLTLEQFYAPTPLPPELLTPLVTPRHETPTPDVSPKRIHSQTSVEDVPKKSKTVSFGDEEYDEAERVTMMNEDESVDAIEMGLETAKIASKESDEDDSDVTEVKEEEKIQEEPKKMWFIDLKNSKSQASPETQPLPSPPKTQKPAMQRPGVPANRPTNPYMTRSKTFHGEVPAMHPVQYSDTAAEKFHLKREPSTLTNVDLQFKQDDRYVINKHIPIQLSKKKQTQILPPENPPPHLNRPKRMNVLRGYSSFEDRDTYEQSLGYHKPSRPHLTRAHTFFGKTSHTPMNACPEYAPKQNLGIAVEGKATCQRHEGLAGSPPPQTGKKEDLQSKKSPLYSSASSWRSRKTTFEISKKILKS